MEIKPIVIINGPNLNKIGTRETAIYGREKLNDFLNQLSKNNPSAKINCIQSNHEGEIIDALQKYAQSAAGIIINPGGYAHTSVAIADAIKMVECPIIEVHISNTQKRESYRHQSITGQNCTGIIMGFGLNSYKIALHALQNIEVL